MALFKAALSRINMSWQQFAGPLLTLAALEFPDLYNELNLLKDSALHDAEVIRGMDHSFLQLYIRCKQLRTPNGKILVRLQDILTTTFALTATATPFISNQGNTFVYLSKADVERLFTGNAKDSILQALNQGYFFSED